MIHISEPHHLQFVPSAPSCKPVPAIGARQDIALVESSGRALLGHKVHPTMNSQLSPSQGQP